MIFTRCTWGVLGCSCQTDHGLADMYINWAGGLHHAKSKPRFYYINDIVLAILELQVSSSRSMRTSIFIMATVWRGVFVTDRLDRVVHKFIDFFLVPVLERMS